MIEGREAIAGKIGREAIAEKIGREAIVEKIGKNLRIAIMIEEIDQENVIAKVTEERNLAPDQIVLREVEEEKISQGRDQDQSQNLEKALS